MVLLSKFWAGVCMLSGMRDIAGEITGTSPLSPAIKGYNVLQPVFIRYLLKLTCIYLGHQDPNFKFQRAKKVTYHIMLLASNENLIFPFIR